MRRWRRRPFTEDDRALLMALADAANFVTSEFLHTGTGLNIMVREGQVARSRYTLAKELGWTVSKVRHRLKRLVKKGELAITTYRRGRAGIHVITIVALSEIYMARGGKKLTTHLATHSRQGIATTYGRAATHLAAQSEEERTKDPLPSPPAPSQTAGAVVLPPFEGGRPPSQKERTRLRGILSNLGLELKPFMLGQEE